MKSHDGVGRGWGTEGKMWRCEIGILKCKFEELFKASENNQQTWWNNRENMRKERGGKYGGEVSDDNPSKEGEIEKKWEAEMVQI